MKNMVKRRNKAKSFLIFALIFILLIQLQAYKVYAFDFEELINSEESTINFDVISNFNVENKSGMQNISLNLGLYPESNSYQKVLSIITEPEATEENNTLKVVWNKINIMDSLSFQLSSRVKITKRSPNIIKSVPLSGINTKINKTLGSYIKKTSRFDYNDKIMERASSIVEGSPDEFTSVSRIGFWIYKNLNYDLNYSNKVENASWVYENMKGTCDEFSALMIAMLRSIGIPSREVNGFAYSNMEVIKGFNAHSWVEVYFPNYGWQQFDPSYGEFGSVDVSHLKLKNSSISYSWYGSKSKITNQRTNASAYVISYSGKINDVSIKTGVLDEKVGINSYNVVYATITNLFNAYNAKCFKISESANVMIISENEKCFVLKPKSNYTVAWLIQNKNLDKRYIYTIPISVYNNEIEKTTSFKSAIIYDDIDFEEVDSFKNSVVSNNNILKRKISLNCYPKELFEDENNLKCYFTNTGNIGFKEINICFDNECKRTRLLINENQELNFSVVNKSNKTTRVKLTYISGNETWNDFLELKTLKKPVYNLKIKENETESNVKLILNIEGEGGFNKKTKILGDNFVLKQEVSNPIIEFDIDKNLLHKGNNTLKIRFYYEDKHYRKYLIEKEVNVFVKNKSFTEIIKYYLYLFINKIENFIG